MSYETVKTGIIGILNSVGLSRSLEVTSFDSVPVEQYENTFILRCESGEADLQNEHQYASLYDVQEWIIQVAFGKSGQSEMEQMDAIHRKRDAMMVELDDPSSWRSFVNILRYKSWTLKDNESYYLLEIKLKAIDVLTY